MDSNITILFFFIFWATVIHDFFKSLKSGILFLKIGVGTVTINISIKLISFLFEVNLIDLALDSSFKALKIGAGDEVIVTARTYIASVTSIVNAGATPIFADIDLNSQNISIKSVRSKITKKTKAIVCVHLAGWPCEMDEIMTRLSQQKNKERLLPLRILDQTSDLLRL